MIQIPNKVYDEILDWAKQGLPNEACGLLAGVREGEDVKVEKVYCMQNTDHSAEHFSMDAREQFTAIRDMRKNGWILIGNVHSHPSSPARPSEEDKRLAYDGGILYLILSLQEEEPDLKAFRITDRKNVSRVEIRYID